MKEKIIKYGKITLFIIMLILSFFASDKIGNFILALDKNLFTRIINVILVGILVWAFLLDIKTTSKK